METELQITRTRGGNTHPIAMKEFVIAHLAAAGEDYPAGIRQAYIEKLKELAEEKGRKRAYHKPTYHSFLANLNKLMLEGLLVPSGREEESDDPRFANLEPKPMRRYFRLAGAEVDGHRLEGLNKLGPELGNGFHPVLDGVNGFHPISNGVDHFDNHQKIV